MWVPFPNSPVEVPAQPDEDCRGHVLVGVAVAIMIEAAILCGAMLIYELVRAVAPWA